VCPGVNVFFGSKGGLRFSFISSSAELFLKNSWDGTEAVQRCRLAELKEGDRVQ
jgi:hypothetical protein